MKLTDIVVELGKVQTAKDRPAFKTPQQIEKEGAEQFATTARARHKWPDEAFKYRDD